MTIPWLNKPISEIEPEATFGGEGLAFDAFGNYAKTLVRYGYRGYIPEKPNKKDHFPECYPDFMRRAGKEDFKWWVYWNLANVDKARAGMEWLKERGDTKFAALQRFVVTAITDTNDVLNWNEETRAKFTSGSLENDFQFGQTLGGQWGAMYHIVWVPAMVRAVAMYLRYFGGDDIGVDFSGVPDLDFSLMELVRADGEITINGETHEFGSDPVWFHLIGDHTEKDKEDPNHPLNSVFGQRRQALYEALGEENREVLSPKQATSELLATCLTFAHSGWQDEAWAKTTRVFDPHPSHVRNDTETPREITVVTALYPDRETALQASNEEQERRDGLIAQANGQVEGGFGEHETREQFVEALAETLFEDYGMEKAGTVSKMKLNKIAKKFEVEVDVVEASLEDAFALM